MKVILAIENNTIEERIKSIEGIKVESNGGDLQELINLIPYFSFSVEYLLINKDLTDDIELLLDIAVAAQKKNIKIVMLASDFDGVKAKKEIMLLAAEEVYAFIDINSFNESELIDILNNYPKEFNFRLLADPEIKFVEVEKTVEIEKPVEVEVEREVIKTIRNQVITCFSVDDSFIGAEVAAELANSISNKSNLKVLLIDFNNINPIIADILGVERVLKVSDKYEIKKQTSLEALVNAIDRDTLSIEIFRELVQKDKRYKFDIVTGIYDLIFDDKVNGEHYKKVIDIAQGIYDVVIIATNPYIKNEATYHSLINSTHILGITNNNYTAIYNLLANIKYINPKIMNKEIKIIMANNSEYSLAKDKLEELFKGYNIVANLPSYDGRRDKSLNEGKLYSEVVNNIKQIYDDIAADLGHIQSKTKKKGFFSLVRR